MQPIGKTYLIKMECKKNQNVGGIYLPDINTYQSIPYVGFIESIGTLIENPLKIGTKVICNYKTRDKNSTKLMLGEDLFYIYNEQDILATINEE